MMNFFLEKGMSGCEREQRRKRLGLTPHALARICNEFKGFSIGIRPQDILLRECVPADECAEDAVDVMIHLALKHVECDIRSRVASIRGRARHLAKKNDVRTRLVLVRCERQQDLRRFYPNEAPYGLKHHHAFIGLIHEGLHSVPADVEILPLPSEMTPWARLQHRKCPPETILQWLTAFYGDRPMNPPLRLRARRAGRRPIPAHAYL